MSKATRLAASARLALSEASNAVLVHICEHGHKHCAIKPAGACAEEAAELQHVSIQGESAAPVTVQTHGIEYTIPASWPIVAAGNAPAAPVKSEQMQQSLF